jgi:activator of HSP90 ATPase
MSREVGGAFSIFRGHILGRHIELVPNERIVQAWRVANWNPGVYSIAKFELVEQGSGTKIVFDHTGFPSGKRNTWRRVGKGIIGSRSRDFWRRRCAGPR